MQNLMLLLFAISASFPFFVVKKWMPPLGSYLVELICLVTLLYVLANGMRQRFQNVRPAYWVIFGSFVVVIICGIIANHETPGPIFAGLRTYLRGVPLFLLPAVYAFTDKQLKTQLRLWVFIALCQVPIAIAQRYATVARQGITGDETSGTFIDSSLLSIFLVCAICVLTAFYRRGQLSGRQYAILFLLFLLPTTINETKGTVILLPIGLMMTFLVLAPRGAKLKNVLVALSLLIIAGSIFVPVYDYFIQKRPYATKIGDFFTDENRFDRYLSPKGGATLGTTKRANTGRLDGIVVPFSVLKRDPSHLTFGLGIGNASDSALGGQFVGQYYRLFQPFLESFFTRLVLEMGLVGVFLVLVLYFTIYKDSRWVLDHDDGIRGSLSAAWSAIMPLMALSLFYKDLVVSEPLMTLFWFYSGVIAAERMRIARDDRADATPEQLAAAA